MRLYLSSFGVGDHPEHLTAMVGHSARAGVIANAMDEASAADRSEAVRRQVAALTGLGINAVELDLREYVGNAGAAERLHGEMSGFQLVWLCGGNVFMLRHALWRGGADTLFCDLLAADALVYGGYSAGVCVLAPSLRGLETVDDAAAVTRIYGEDTVWEGLGVLDYAIVPHCQSPEHPENAELERVADRYKAKGIPHRTLRDGQALVVRNGITTLV